MYLHIRYSYVLIALLGVVMLGGTADAGFIGISVQPKLQELRVALGGLEGEFNSIASATRDAADTVAELNDQFEAGVPRKKIRSALNDVQADVAGLEDRLSKAAEARDAVELQLNRLEPAVLLSTSKKDQQAFAALTAIALKLKSSVSERNAALDDVRDDIGDLRARLKKQPG